MKPEFPGKQLWDKRREKIQGKKRRGKKEGETRSIDSEQEVGVLSSIRLNRLSTCKC